MNKFMIATVLGIVAVLLVTVQADLESDIRNSASSMQSRLRNGMSSMESGGAGELQRLRQNLPNLQMPNLSNMKMPNMQSLRNELQSLESDMSNTISSLPGGQSAQNFVSRIREIIKMMSAGSMLPTSLPNTPSVHI